MMDCFDVYGKYYDLLYHDKDYAAEADYVDSLIVKYGGNSVPSLSILELGCGTGRHAAFLNRKGYRVHGIDASDRMIASAKDREKAGLVFEQGDVRVFRCKEKFGAVISLFHIASYQPTNADLRGFAETAAFHLHSGGIFVFDFWYGPAVLSDRPAVRIKRTEDDTRQLVRIAEPVMRPNDNIVDVNYTLMIRDKASGIFEEIKETHRLRYLFLPELMELMQQAGFSVINTFEWMKDRPLGFETWYGVMVARK